MIKTIKDAMNLYENSSISHLENTARVLRDENKADGLELCSIVNFKSGKCSENCIFCSQSIHYNTDIEEYDFLDKKTVLENAKIFEKNGVKRFSLVTSGKSLSDEVFDRVAEMASILNRETSLILCASLGLLTIKQAEKLKQAGITRYHHNIEASKEFFPKMCTTHSFQDRINTVKNAKKAGIQVCSGGIFGIGETADDRFSMALSLKELELDSVALNILMPVEGTPAGAREKPSFEEIYRTGLLYRIILGSLPIRLCGGRPVFTQEEQDLLLKNIFNAVMVGNYLTEDGSELESDIKRIRKNGFLIV